MIAIEQHILWHFQANHFPTAINIAGTLDSDFPVTVVRLHFIYVGVQLKFFQNGTGIHAGFGQLLA